MCLEEKGHEWFGRERFWVWKRSHFQYRKKKEEGNMGFGFGREGPWVVWKRKVLGLQEKPFAGTGKKKEEGN